MQSISLVRKRKLLNFNVKHIFSSLLQNVFFPVRYKYNWPTVNSRICIDFHRSSCKWLQRTSAIMSKLTQQKKLVKFCCICVFMNIIRNEFSCCHIWYNTTYPTYEKHTRGSRMYKHTNMWIDVWCPRSCNLCSRRLVCNFFRRLNRASGSPWPPLWLLWDKII